MLKVECEACKALYQIDERRVPPSGLKMRCSKCGHSFLVPSETGPSVPLATPASPSGAAATQPTRPGVAGRAPPPPGMRNLRATMVGVGDGGTFEPLPSQAPHITVAEIPVAASPTAGTSPAGSSASPGAKAGSSFGRRTMVGVAPGAQSPPEASRSQASPPQASPQAAPAPPVSPFKATVPAMSSLKALALGATTKPTSPNVSAPPLAGAPSLKPLAPGLVRQPALGPPASGVPTQTFRRPPTPGAAVPGRSADSPAAGGPAGVPPSGDAFPSDFPAALGGLEESDLPAVSRGLPAGKPPVPSPGKAPGLAPPKPAVVAYKPPAAEEASAAPIDDLDFDLPSVPDDLPAARVRPGLPAASASKSSPGKPPPALPSPARTSPPAFEMDLPVPVSDLPSARSPFGADLPSVRPASGADLPSVRPASGADLPSLRASTPAAPGPRAPAFGDVPAVRASALEASRAAYLSDLPVIAPHDRSGPGDVGLPVVSASLPQVRDGHANLPVPAASLPARSDPRANLPALQASLPVRSEAHLPSPAASLPIPLDSLPIPTAAVGGMGFGEIELPTFGDQPPSSGAQRAAQPAARSRSSGVDSASFGLFGEIDLPHESPPSSSRTPSAAPNPPAGAAPDFADIELEERPRSIRPPAQSLTPPILRAEGPKSAGGLSFGEVDMGGSAGADAGSIGLDADDRLGRNVAREAPVGLAAASAAVRTPGGPQEASAVAPRRPSLGRSIGAGVAVLAIVGGAALQFTPHGAFGYLTIGDWAHASEYARVAAAAIDDTDKAAAPDTYDASKAALDAVYAAQQGTVRARALTAYAAFADYATTVRFGADAARASRAAQLLANLPTEKPTQYTDAALAAQAAVGDDLDKARKAVNAASQHAPPADPIQHDLSLLAGELALTARDGAAAVVAFKRALASSSDARGHFGLARSYDLVGDAASEKQEIEATLATSPGHPGALTLRAHPKTGLADPVKALADLAVVLDGPSRAKASPRELSLAYAAKAWVSLERGAATDAREAFAQAVRLDPGNVDALNGQGRLFLNEDRSTEALARFDTALGIDPNSVETIVNDAEAKIALERLADAKQQLVAAREKFPKSIPTLILLGKVEQHLGNSDAAEADLRAAIALVDPSRPDAVLPYVALSKLLSERGHVADGRAALEEAKRKLTPSPALERAFGEISELQGDYDGAIAHFNSALAADSKNATSHFLLGVALRRVRKFDSAASELDKVAAVDKDYPGLSLERGLLFEESGDVQKAIEQFNGALAKAPDDPDLLLRVGAAYVAIGRPDEALPMLHKVLDKRPTSAEAHHFIGRALMLQPGPEQGDALRYLKRAVDLDPNRAEFHVYVAWAANDATPAQLELARDEIDRALTLDNLNAEAYWQRGVLERMEGADEDSIKDENHALALRPSRYEAHATLAQCFEDKNQEAAALGEWARAIAGDVEAPDATTVRHPFWRFRYGKMLMDRGGPAVALAQLLPAATTAETISPKPGWLAPLEFLAAEALRKTGKRADAIEHYKRFLDIAPVNSPDRFDAQQALATLAAR